MTGRADRRPSELRATTILGNCFAAFLALVTIDAPVMPARAKIPIVIAQIAPPAGTAEFKLPAADPPPAPSSAEFAAKPADAPASPAPEASKQSGPVDWASLSIEELR